MCSSNLFNSVVSSVTKPIGGLAKDVIGEVPIVGKPLNKALQATGDYLESETANIPIIRENVRAFNELHTGSNLEDTKREAQNQVNYANESLQQIGTAPDPFNIDDEDQYLASLRAKYREDARARRFRGRAGTILTGGQGVGGAAPTSTPTLSGRSLRLF